MSKSARSKAKRIFAALLVGVLISGTVPFTPLSGIAPRTMVVKALDDDITRLLTDDDGGYYYYLPYQDTETLDLSGRDSGFSFDVRTERDGEEGYRTDCYDSVCIVAPEGMRIEVTGSISTEEGCDTLNIYDGSNNGFTNIFSGSGEKSVDLISSQNQIYIQFSSDGSVASDGVNLHIRFVEWIQHGINIEPTQGGTVEADKESAYQEENVTLTINPQKGYVLQSLTYTDENENVHPIENATWYSDTATFIMPETAVTVTPTFIKGENAENLTYYLYDGDAQFAVPEGVSSFKVVSTEHLYYEEEYEDGEYYREYLFRGRLIITAPEGHYMTFNILDGSGTEYDFFDGLDGIYSIGSGVPTKNNKGSISVDIDDSSVYTFQCTVNISEREPHSITLNQAQGGTVAVADDITSAKMGQLVTVTATPDHENGYQFVGMDVVDEDGQEVAVNVDAWYTGTSATFTMPDKAVSVTPVFDKNSSLTYDLEGGDNQLVIPQSVKNFMITSPTGNSGTLQLVAPEGYIMKINGGMSTTSDSSFYLYDGEDNTGAVLTETHSRIIEENEATVYEANNAYTSGNNAFLQYDINWDDYYSNLYLNVTVVRKVPHDITIEETEGGTISVAGDLSSAGVGDLVEVTAAPDTDNGYIRKSFSVIDEDGAIVDVGSFNWYDGDTFSFRMPEKAITISAEFTDKPTASGGLYINMPSSGTKNITIPEGIRSFKLYGDNGQGQNVSDYFCGSLKLTAPEGCVFVVEGNVQINSDGRWLAIYNNGNASGNNIYFSCESDPTLPFTTTGNAIFITSGYDWIDGYSSTMDLTVRVVDTSVSHRVTLKSAEGGQLTATPARGVYDTDVTIKSNLMSGYKLAGLEITDADGEPVSFTGGKWYSEIASFKMPDTNVTVTPTFTNDLTAEGGLSVEMPGSGTSIVDVPADIKSFKVDYDGNCDYYDEGILVINAPENCRVMVSGTVTKNNTEDAYVYVADNYGEGNDVYGDGGIDTSDAEKTFSTISNTNRIFIDRYGRYALDLKVSFIDTTAENSITAVNSEFGTVTPSVEAARWNDDFSVTAVGESGFVPKKLIMKDEKGNVLDEKYVDFTTGTATFIMPYYPVTVEAEYESELTAESGLEAMMPTSGSRNVVLPENIISFKLYDDGGKDKTFTEYCDGSITFTAPEGKRIMISGSVTAYYNNCTAYIYNGSSTEVTPAVTLSNSENGGKTALDPVLSTGNVVTVRFEGGYNDRPLSGMDFLVNVVDPEVTHTITCEASDHGRISADYNVAVIGSPIVIAAYPDEGYVLNGLVITDEAGNTRVLEDAAWYNGNTATLFVPDSDITVSAIFVPENERFVNLPEAGTKEITLDRSVTTLRLYDNGGKDGKYSAPTNGAVILHAPDGCLIQAFGTVKTDNNSYLYIRDDWNTLYETWGTDGNTTNLDTYTASSGALNVAFSTGENSTDDGFELNVRVIDPNTYRAVEIAPSQNGTVTVVGQPSKKYGETVELKATANEGYHLKKITVVDEDGKSIYVSGNNWYTEKPEFSMPGSRVTVTAEFEEGVSAAEGLLYYLPGTEEDDAPINMQIPNGITSFKVLSQDGTYYYSKTLNMTAPEGYVLKIEGHSEGIRWDGEDFQFSLSDNYGSIPSSRYLTSKTTGEEEEEEQNVVYTINPVTATGDMLSLAYTKEYTDSYNFPLDVTVTVVKADETHSITCYNADGGTVSCEEAAAQVGSTVTLIAVPDSGYVLTGMNVRNENGCLIPVQGTAWYEGNSVTFTMPYSNVSATPVFATESTYQNLSINVPASGQTDAVIPSGVKSFRITGGSAESRLNITAPEGYVVEFSGTLEDISGTNEYTLEFTGTNNNIIATLVDATVKKKINVEEPDNGSFTVTANGEAITNASPGTLITVTAQPDDGYFLKSIVVEDKNGDPIRVSGGSWYSDNTATFKMPNGPVTVIAEFTQGTYSVNVPDGGTETIRLSQNVKNFKVYDAGGSIYGYTGDSDGKLVISAPEGYVLKISGSYLFADSGDKLSVFNGTADEELAYITEAYGSRYTIEPIYSSGNVVTIGFASNSSGTSDGFDLDVELINADEDHAISTVAAQGGTIEVAETGKWNRNIIVTANAEPGYMLTGLTVTDASGAEIKVSGELFSNKRTFTMPASAVTVTPVFSNDLTAENGLYVNMPATGGKNVTLPAGVRSFMLYDDGGKDGVFADYSNGTVTFTAPQGCLFEVSGTYFRGDGKELNFYDGENLDEAFANFWSNYEKDEQINTGVTTTNKLTVKFNAHDENYDSAQGFALKVRVYDLLAEHDVICEPCPEGSLLPVNDKYTAKYNDNVVLKALTEDGYLLTGVTVTDENGKNIPVKGGTWYNDTVVFTMPMTAVTVNAEFSKDLSAEGGLFVNMPADGTIDVNMPEIVESFRLYDDGGKDGNYSQYANGIVRITVPQNKKILIEGDVRTNSDSKLEVYNKSTGATAASQFVYTGPGTDYPEISVVDPSQILSEPTSYGICGTMTNWGGYGKADIPMYDIGNGIMQGQILLSSGEHQFKVRTNNEWDYNWGAYYEGYGCTSDSENVVVSLTQASVVTVFLDTRGGDSSQWPISYSITPASELNGGLVEGGVFSGSTKVSLISDENELNLMFTTSGYEPREGFDLKVSMIDPDKTFDITCKQTDNGTVGTSVTSAKLGQKVTVTANAEPGKVLNKVTVTDSKGNKVDVSNGFWYQNGEISFTMPYDSVTVTPEFVDIKDGLSITLQKNSSESHDTTIFIPEGAELVRVNSDNSDWYSSRVTFIAADGKKLQITGQGVMGEGDEVNIYDFYENEGYEDEEVFHAYGNESLTPVAIGPFFTGVNRIGVEYRSNKNENAAGLDLAVRVYDPQSKFAVTCGTAQNGTLTADCEVALPGSTVTLNAEPASGYLLAYVTVTDADGNNIPVSGGSWQNNTATFTMPATPVTVSAVFSDDLSADTGAFVIMPSGNNTKVVDIPSGMTSLMIYDDGGKNGEYSNGCDSTLELNAPGCTFTVSGPVSTESGWDWLRLYDGNKESEDYVSYEGDNQQVSFSTTGSKLTLFFHSDSSGTRYGFALRAELSPIIYHITLDTAGGTLADGESDFMAYNVRSSDIVLPTPTMEGSRFRGWSIDGGEPVRNAVVPKGSYGDKTFTAMWADEDYRFVTMPEGVEIIDVTGEQFEDMFRTGTVISFRVAVGYAAEGDITLNGEVITPDENGVYEITIDDDAQIEGNIVSAKHTITYRVNGETFKTIEDVPYNSIIEIIEDEPELEGYTFKGWGNVPAKMPNSDLVLDAVFEVNQYTVTFNTNGGTAIDSITADYGTELTAPEDPTRYGYTFIGWDKDIPATMPSENIVINADWTVNEYTLTFKDGDNVIATITQDYDTAIIAAPSASKEGYTFMGWDKNVPARMPGEDMTFNAIFAPKKYTITFDTDGGSTISAITQDFGTEVKAPEAPTKAGYRFVGWDKDIPATMPAENMTVTAVWEKLADLENVSTISADTLEAGQTLTVNAAAQGGDGSYTYAVYYKLKTDSTWLVGLKYGKASTANIKLDNTGVYEVCTKVKDSTGTEAKQYFDVTVTAPVLRNVSTVSADTLNAGDTLTVNAAAQGGEGSYTYAVYYRLKTASSWTVALKYGTKSTVDIKLDNTGEYEVCAKVKDSTGTEAKQYFDVTVKDNVLTNTSTISSETIEAGETLTVNAAAQGGEGSYTYAVYYRLKTASSWTVALKYGTKSTVDIKLDNTGEYEVCAKVKDSTGTEAKQYFDVTVTAPALRNVSTISADTLDAGNTLTVNAAAQGGDGSYTYAVYYRLKTASSWTVALKYGTKSTVDIKLDKAGVYEVCAKVKDSTGTEAKQYFDVTVNETELKNVSTISADTLNAGDTLTVNAIAQGGKGGYTYAVYYKLKTASSWTVALKYGTKSTANIKLDKAGVYEVCAKVKDSAGTEAKQYFDVTVEDTTYTNTSTISSDIIKPGETITVNASAKNGQGSYTYAVYYKLKTASSWTTALKYGTKSTVDIKLDNAGEYEICAKVKDSTGAELKVYFRVIVSDSLAINSKISSTSVKPNEKIKVSVAAGNGTAPYTYAVYYKLKTASSWSVALKYGDISEVSFKLADAGEYQICAKAKDSKKEEVKEYFDVTVG